MPIWLPEESIVSITNACVLLRYFQEHRTATTNRHSLSLLKKAFDSVPHEELVFKLWKLGITGPLWLWFRSYLSNRLHSTCILNHSSSYLPVYSGVPQGSVLGPLLFLIFINDLRDSILYLQTLSFFADDTKLVKCIESSLNQQLLQIDLDNLSS